MDKLKKIPIGLWIVIVLVLSMCGLTAFNIYSSLESSEFNIVVFTNIDKNAKVEDSLTLDVPDQPINLTIDSQGGDIIIVASDRDDIQVDMVKTGWGGTVGEAQQAAENLEVVVEENDEGITLTFKDSPKVSVFSSRNGIDHIDFTVYVPKETNLALNTRFGKISTNDSVGVLIVNTYFGDVRINNHEGRLTLDGRNGEVSIENVTAENHTILIENDFGDIELTGLSAENITVNSRNGRITATDLISNADLNIDSQFGDITITNFESDQFTVTSRNGKINLSMGNISSLLTISSDFGDIDFEQVSASDTRLETKNGKIMIDSMTGKLFIDSDFGAVTIKDGEYVALDVI